MSWACVSCGVAAGAGVVEVVGVCAPCACSAPALSGKGDGFEAGVCGCIFIPGMCSCEPVLVGCGRDLLFRRAVVLAFRFALRLVFALAFGLLMFMPDMFCMSCP